MKALWKSKNGDFHLVLVMRIIALFAGTMQLLFGNVIIGIATILTVCAIMLPDFFTRGRVKALPIEFELVFITMVMLQFVIGEALDFYDHIPYYDKFVHFSLPLFVGFISFLIAYTLHEIGALRVSTGIMVVVIIFMTLGVGACWEIIEFLSDEFLHPRFDFIPHLQGSVIESAHVDTMRDLIVDLIGGVFGALLGLRYISSKSMNVKARLEHIVKVIGANFKIPN